MTATELISLLEQMPDDAPIVIPGEGGHFDILNVTYDAQRDAIMLLPE